MLDLLDYYAAGWPYLFIGFTEFIIIGYVYGVQNYFDDLYHMTKLNPGMWGKSHLVFLYMTLSPLIIFVSKCCYILDYMSGLNFFIDSSNKFNNITSFNSWDR